MRITFFDPQTSFDPERNPQVKTFNVRINGEEVTNPILRILIVLAALFLAALVFVIVLPIVGILVIGTFLLFIGVVIVMLPLAPLLLIFKKRGDTFTIE